MTTSRNIRAVIEVGGQVAASLPSATRRARAELKSLEEAQQGDVGQLRSQRQSLDYVAKGSDTYNRRLQEIDQTQQRLNFRTDKIIQSRDALKDAGGEAGGFRGRMMQVRSVLGPVGIALGAATALVVGLGAAFRGAGRSANELTNTSALYGQTVENIQRRRNLFQYFTQDAGQANAAARNLLDVSEQFQRVQFGAGAGPDQFLAANRLGFNPADLIQGNLDQRQIIEQAIAGVQGLPDVEARLRLEQAGFSEDVRAAVLIGAKEGIGPALAYQQRQAVLSEEQLNANRDMGRNVDEILTQIGRLVQITLSGIAPPLLSMSTAILQWLGGPDGALRGEQQELEFRRSGLRERRDAELEEYQRAATRASPEAFGGTSPEASALQTTNRELGGIDERLAEISLKLQRNQDIDLAGQYPGPLGNIPGAERLAERGVSAGDLAKAILQDPSLALSGLVPNSVPRIDYAELGRFLAQRPSLPDLDYAELGRNLIKPPTLPDFGFLGAAVKASPPLAGVTPRQLGGRVRPGEVTLVGEEGPEVARFPAGTEILPTSIPDVGVRAPKVPDIGVRVPSIPDVGVRVPPIPDVGVRAPFIPAQSVQGQDPAQLKSAFAQALAEAGFAGGQPTTYNQNITQNITNNSGDDIGQKLIDAQAANPVN